MDRQTVDALLTGMLETVQGASDLLFIAGKPPLVEVHEHPLSDPSRRDEATEEEEVLCPACAD